MLPQGLGDHALSVGLKVGGAVGGLGDLPAPREDRVIRSAGCAVGGVQAVYVSLATKRGGICDVGRWGLPGDQIGNLLV